MNQEASRSQFISHPLESSHQERKRIFTPSRTVFSSVQQRGAPQSPKIRSVNEPFVGAPSQPAFNPLSAGRVVEMYRVNHQQVILILLQLATNYVLLIFIFLD
jgi:hypothetical protein